jgi:hypothetical protein
MIFHEDFSPEKNKKFDVEQANRLANEIIATAQNDCDATPKRREAYFQIAIIDKNRRAVPLIRRIGPLRPQRHNALLRSGDSPDAESEEEELSAQNLSLIRLKTGLEEARWGNIRNDRVLGELLMLYRDALQNNAEELRLLRAEAREREKAMQEALDLRLQREMMLEEKKFSIGLKKEALRMGRNLLPGLFAEARADQLPQNGHANGNGHTENPQPQYGTSTERALVDSFLTDCEEEGLLETLFGEAEEQNGKLVVTKPGILSPKQVRILVGVRLGFLPPDALDPVMPESGHALEITMKQITEAMDAGVTEGIGMALVELKEVRKQAREKAAAVVAAAATKTTNPAPTATT